MLNTFTSLLLAGLIAVFASSCATTQPGSIAYYKRFAGTYAVDTRGRHYSSKDFGDSPPPWLSDVVHGVGPAYPYAERAARHQGKGFFRVFLDVRTGTVATVEVAKSTGFNELDNSAVAALKQWRWQPNKWREIDIPITFKLDRNRDIPSGAVRLPSQ